MAVYRFRYFFEWGAGGDCLWADNDAARERYDYNPAIRDLPLSEALAVFLDETGYLHDDALNWDYPPDPPDPEQWTPEKEADFCRRAREGYERLCAELGADYEIQYEVKI